MHVYVNDIATLQTVIPHCIIETRVYIDEDEIVYEESCHSASNPSYYWTIRKFGFESEAEMKAYVVLNKLESL